jgi:hypothetical protein
MMHTLKKSKTFIQLTIILTLVLGLVTVSSLRAAWTEPSATGDARSAMVNRGPVAQVREAGLGIGGNLWSTATGNLFNDKITVHQPVDFTGGFYAKNDTGPAAIIHNDLYAGYALSPGATTATPFVPVSYSLNGNVEATNNILIANLAHSGVSTLAPVCTTTEGWLVPCSGTTTPPTEICNDGIDNDGDGDIDAADSDCPAPPVVPPTAVSNCYVVSNAQGSQHWTLRCDPAKNADNSDVTQYEVDFLEYQNNYPTGVWTPEGTYNGAQYCDPLSCVTGYVRVAGVITSGTPFANSLYRIRGINAAGPGPWEYYVGSNIQSFYDSQVTFTENATFPATALNTTIEWNPIASRLYLDGLAPGGFVIARCSAGGTCFNYPPPGSGQGISINSNIRIEAVIPYTGSTPTQSTKTYASMNGTAGDTYMLLHRKPLRAMPSVGSTVTLSNLSGYELVDYITR